MAGIDRISLLSDDLLCHILSFVSTKEAVGTSVLSKRWRDVHSRVLSLDFQMDEPVLREWSVKNGNRSLFRRKRYIERFCMFVNKHLIAPLSVKVEKLRLRICSEVEYERVYGWIYHVTFLGVQHIDLSISTSSPVTTLPDDIWTCSTLVSLRVDLENMVLHTPHHVSLPNLKSLHLNSIEIADDDAVGTILSGSPVLEELVLLNCDIRNIEVFDISHDSLKRVIMVFPVIRYYYENHTLQMDTPMVSYFKYHANEAAGYRLKDMVSLQHADVHIVPFQIYDYRAIDASPFFMSIRNVPSLTMSSTTLQDIVNLLNVSVHSSFLKTVRNIEIWKFEDNQFCMSMVKYLIAHAEQLDLLTMQPKYVLDDDEKASVLGELLDDMGSDGYACQIEFGSGGPTF